METMDRKIRQLRSDASQFQVREAEGDLSIEGYFSVFNSIYELWPGATESVAPGAFSLKGEFLLPSDKSFPCVETYTSL